MQRFNQTIKSKTQRAILTAALELFTEQGYFNTTVHHIQARAGVSIGSIYHHFGSKETIAQALYDTLLEHMNQQVEHIANQQSPHQARFARLIELLFTQAEQEPMTMRFILNARHQEFLPESTPICSAAPFGRMRDLVVEAMAAGEIRTMEPWVAAAQLFGGALRLIHLHLDNVLGQPLTPLAEETFSTAWRGVCVTP
uniref:Transcription regulator (TetR-family) n=1 Tax=Magnetococcus massalia (strain MO-1) TaxID=451514 RepID=A0A1S7LGV8_MAGMO|nr:Transcription regulator (TetR-family) [Candidatus Magnetococcus massalia]